MTNLKTILNQIDQVMKDIAVHGNAQDTVALLRDANVLSTIRFSLGDMYAEAKQLAEVSKNNYDVTLNSEYLAFKQEPMTDAMAKAKAKEKGMKLYIEYLKHEHTKTLLKVKRDDLAEKISLLQSFASELRSQRNYKEL